jgi:hypothetical protein
MVHIGWAGLGVAELGPMRGKMLAAINVGDRLAVLCPGRV